MIVIWIILGLAVNLFVGLCVVVAIDVIDDDGHELLYWVSRFPFGLSPIVITVWPIIALRWLLS